MQAPRNHTALTVATMPRLDDVAQIAQNAARIRGAIVPFRSIVQDRCVEAMPLHPAAASNFGNLARLVDACPVAVALLDADGGLAMANAAWVQRVGVRAKPTLQSALRGLAVEESVACELQAAVAAVAGGTCEVATHIFLSRGGAGETRCELHAAALAADGQRLTCLFVVDVADIDRLQHEKRMLTAQLLRSEDLERRRIARELHDSTVQDLIAIKLAFKRLRHLDEDAVAQGVFDDIKVALAQALSDLRTLSYLLHPPVIGDAGLGGALSALVSGLSDRMEMRIVFHDEMPSFRCAPDAELALYRIALEALTNVHRHASAEAAVVRLAHRGGAMILEVEDDGVGIGGGSSRRRELGVGIPCMRSRVQQLGGTLRIVRLARGTLVRASLPAVAFVQ